MPGRNTPDDPGGSSPAFPPNSPNQSFTDGEGLPAPRHPSGRRTPGGDPVVPPPVNSNTTVVNTRKVVTVERQISFSSTVLDNTVGVAMGDGRKQVLKCCYRRRTNQKIYLAYLIGAGEIGAVNDILINGDPISEYTSKGWISFVTVNLGDGSPPPTFMTGHPDWNATDDAVFAAHSFIAFQLNIRDNYGYQAAEIPGTLNVEATPTGRIVDDLRGGPDLSSRNPVVLAHWVMRNGRHWPASKLDAASWTAAADVCDEVIAADSSTRYTFDKLVENRDPARVVQNLLQHARAHMYTDAEGNVRLWQESAPEEIGNFTTSAGSDVIVGSGPGAPMPAVGDFVFVGTETRKVLAVAAPNVTVHKEMSSSGLVEVFRIGDFELGLSDWISPPTPSARNPFTVPEAVNVRFADPEVRGQHDYTYPTTGSPERRLEATYDGCTVPGMAARIAKHLFQIEIYEHITLTARAGGRAAPLEPGDRIVISDEAALEYFPVTVLDPVTNELGGGVSLRLKQFAIEPYSGPRITHTIPAHIDPNETDPADPPTDATKTFGELGNWDLGNLIPDPDNLDTGWSSNGCTVNYVPGTPTGSTIISNTAGSDCYNRITVSGLDPTGEVFVSFLAKSSDAANDWIVGYTIAGHVGLNGYADIVQDGKWHRYTIRANVGVSSHGIKIWTDDTSAGDLEIKRFRIRPWTFNPSLSLYERSDWTPHAGAGTTVARHVARSAVSGQVVGTAGPAAEDLEIRTFTFGLGTDPGERGGISKLPPSTSAPTGEFDMFVRGFDGIEYSFPDPSSYYTEEREVTQTLEETFDVNPSTRAIGRAVTWDGSTHRYEEIPPDISALTGYPTGFPDSARAGSEMSFTKSTRTFAFKLTGGAITVYLQGRPIEISFDLSVVLPDVTGTVFVYMDSSGVLQHTTVWDRETMLIENVYLAAVYLDGSSPKDAIYIGDERHRFMEPESHFYIHSRWGAYIESGFALGDLTTDASGNLDSHATLSVASGILRDEDLTHSFPGAASPAPMIGFYLSGATPEMVAIPSTGAPWHKATSRAYFNELSGGTWGLTEIGSNNNYLCSHLVAINETDDSKIVGWIMGQVEYGTRNAARDGAAAEAASILSLLPTEEISFIGTLIGKTSAGMSNTWAVANQTVDADGTQYIDWTQTELARGNPPTSHGALSDRDLPNSHPDDAIAISGTFTDWLAGAADVSDALAILDGLAGGFTSGSQNFDGNSFLTYKSHDGVSRLDIQAFYFHEDYLAIGQHTPSLSYLDEIRLWSPTNLHNNTQLGGRVLADTSAVHLVSINSSDNSVWGQVGQDNYWFGFQKNPFYFDGDAGDAILSVAGKGTSADVLLTDSNKNLLFNTNQYLNANNLFLYGTETGAAQRKIIGINTSNQVQIASTSSNVSIQTAGFIYANGTFIISNGYVRVQNGQYYAALDSGGLERTLAQLNTSNVVILGNLSNQMELHSAGNIKMAGLYMTFPNNRSIRCLEAGGTSRVAFVMNTSDQIKVGNTANELRFESDGGIAVGGNDLDNAGAIDTSHVRSVRSKSLTSGVSTEFARAFFDAAPDAGGILFFYEVEVIDGSTNQQIESGMVNFSQRRGTVSRIGAGLKFGNQQLMSAGTLSVSFSFGGSGADHGRLKINATTSLLAPTIKVHFTAIGNSDKNITWS
jgi:hypothetical protein